MAAVRAVGTRERPIAIVSGRVGDHMVRASLNVKYRPQNNNSNLPAAN